VHDVNGIIIIAAKTVKNMLFASMFIFCVFIFSMN
jgi:hypothetical protein